MAKRIIALNVAMLLTMCLSSLTGAALAKDTVTKPALKVTEGQFSTNQQAKQKAKAMQTGCIATRKR